MTIKKMKDKEDKR